MSALARVGLLALTLALPTACAIDRSGLSPPGARADAGVDASVDAGTGPGCSSDASCPPDQVCSLGSCVPRDADLDGDGVPAAVDCDDTDAMVGRTHETACPGPCGNGLERCTDGEWTPCDAPTDCACSPGDMRDLPCPMCGTQGQQCDAAETWQDVGACTGGGVCSPMEVESGMEACGDCGTQTVSRTCDATCAFGDWSPSGACTGQGPCTPGASESRDELCGTCRDGTTTGTRLCEDTCTWGLWSWSDCMDAAECADRFGGTVCPGDLTTTRDGCPGGQIRRCTCGGDGGWTDCSVCYGG